MNASGRPNTCKSNDTFQLAGEESGARVRNAYATYLHQGDSPEKSGLIPHSTIGEHSLIVKAQAVMDEHATD